LHPLQAALGNSLYGGFHDQDTCGIGRPIRACVRGAIAGRDRHLGRLGLEFWRLQQQQRRRRFWRDHLRLGSGRVSDQR
jgi:PEP-CTERM motif